MRNLIIVVLFFITSAISQTQSDSLHTKTDNPKTDTTIAVVDSVSNSDSLSSTIVKSDSIVDESEVTLSDSMAISNADSLGSAGVDTSVVVDSTVETAKEDTVESMKITDSMTVDSVISEVDITEAESAVDTSIADSVVVRETGTIDTVVRDSVMVNGSTTNSDTLLVHDRGDRKYLSHVIKEKTSRKDSLELVKEKTVESGTTQYLYQILLNGEEKWDLSLTTPANDLEDLFVKAAHNQKLKEGEEQQKEMSKGTYSVTPWKQAPSIFTEFKPANKMLDWFAWKSGATINFHRNHLYNFNSYAGDTTQIYVDLGKPALYDLRMDMSYTHRFKFVWVGAGIERSWQNSSYFDTVQVVRGGWFSRMGWNVHVALPGFKYELFRDPGVIPFYAQYEDSLYTKLYPDAQYEYSHSLNMVVDTTYRIEEKQYNESVVLKDTIVVPYKIAPMAGVGHRFTVKVGFFNYSLVVNRQAYKAPINEIGFQDMPFFKGEWDANLLILPNGRVIPHLAIDAYRTAIKLGPGTLGVSPFHFEMEIWGRNHFFVSLGFNAEYLTKKATFRKE